MRLLTYIAGLIFALAPLAAAAQEVRSLRLGAGPIDAVEFQIAGLVGNVISNPPGASGCPDPKACGLPGLVVTVLRTPNAAATVDGIAQGTLEGGLVSADLLWRASKGVGEFTRKPVAKLRHVATLYSETLLVLVKRDGPIKALADLKNRKIAMVDAEGFDREPFRAVLGAANINEKQLRVESLPLERALAKLSLGEIDAVMVSSAEPASLLARAQSPVPIVALGLGDEAIAATIKAHPYFIAAALPGDNGKPGIAVLSVPVQWTVSADLPDDAVSASISALLHPQNRALLIGGHPAIAKFQAARALDGAVLPLHPAAEAYYRQAGILK